MCLTNRYAMWGLISPTHRIKLRGALVLASQAGGLWRGGVEWKPLPRSANSRAQSMTSGVEASTKIKGSTPVDSKEVRPQNDLVFTTAFPGGLEDNFVATKRL